MYEGNYFGRFLKTLWKLASPKDWLTRCAISPLANVWWTIKKAAQSSDELIHYSRNSLNLQVPKLIWIQSLYQYLENTCYGIWYLNKKYNHNDILKQWFFFPFVNTFFSKKMNVMLMNFYQQFPTIHNDLVTAPSCLIMPFKCTLAFGLKLVHLLPMLLSTQLYFQIFWQK